MVPTLTPVGPDTEMLPEILPSGKFVSAATAPARFPRPAALEKWINTVPLFISSRFTAPLLDPLVAMAKYDDEPKKFPTGVGVLTEKLPDCPARGPLRNL